MHNHNNNNYSNNEDEEGEEDEVSVEVRKNLDAFNAEAEALNQAIEKIDKNVTTVHQKYTESLQRNVTHTERADASAQISSLVAQTSKTAQAVRKRLRRIAEENEQFATQFPNNQSTQRIRISTHRAITHNFMASMQRLEDVQERYREAVRLTVERQLRQYNPDAPEQDIKAALQRIQSCTNDGNNQQQQDQKQVDESPLLNELPAEEQARLRAQLDFLSGRNNDIRQLENNMVELNQMFIDMQLLVERQGELLNTIEYNVVETKGKAKAGMDELIEARDFQKKAGRKKWCIALVVILIVLAIAVPLLIRYAPQWFPNLDNSNGTGGNGIASATPAAIVTISPTTGQRDGRRPVRASDLILSFSLKEPSDSSIVRRRHAPSVH